MTDNTLLSKIVANSTDNSWSQAYSTLNLYVVIGIERNEENEKGIGTHGKNILDKLQREFFAIDEKKLEDIKEAVENTVATIEKNIEFSIVLATITNNVLYIVIAGSGSVVIKRGDKIGVIADGVKKRVSSFSGRLENKDFIVFQTKGFEDKISHEKLTELFDNLKSFEIAENIAPLIHGNSKGTEAAIILEYKEKEQQTEEIEDVDEAGGEENISAVEAEKNGKEKNEEKKHCFG